jgi:Outer membrane lipoprotein-sorting protein
LAALGMPGAAKTALDPAEILRRSEEVRSPALDYAVDFSVTVLDDYTPGQPRTATYTMVAAGRERAMILMRGPDQFNGGTFLIRDRDYWLLLPKSTSAIQLSADAVARGDISSGDVARTNLAADYVATLDGEETVDGERCIRLSLAARRDDAFYPKIRGFVTRSRKLPKKYEYFGRSGSLLRTATYDDYETTALGLRSMRLEIRSPGEMNRTTTISFSNIRKTDASTVVFTPEGMLAFRGTMARR